MVDFWEFGWGYGPPKLHLINFCVVAIMMM
jgi:hypothetical protein